MDVDSLAREAAQTSAADPDALVDRIVDTLIIRAERQVAQAREGEVGSRIRDLDAGDVETLRCAEVKHRLHARRASR